MLGRTSWCGQSPCFCVGVAFLFPVSSGIHFLFLSVACCVALAPLAEEGASLGVVSVFFGIAFSAVMVRLAPV